MKIRTDGFRDHELTTSSEEKIATPLYILHYQTYLFKSCSELAWLGYVLQVI